MLQRRAVLAAFGSAMAAAIVPVNVLASTSVSCREQLSELLGRSFRLKSPAGDIVTARLNLARPLDEGTVRREVRKHCRARLEPHKVPARVEVADAPLTTDRQKRIRRG